MGSEPLIKVGYDWITPSNYVEYSEGWLESSEEAYSEAKSCVLAFPGSESCRRRADRSAIRLKEARAMLKHAWYEFEKTL